LEVFDIASKRSEFQSGVDASLTWGF